MPELNQAYKSLDPGFQPMVFEILKKLEERGWQAIVAEGRRTIEQQKEKVRKGYSRTMNSIHLFGRAADIVDKRYLWNISNVHQFWMDLYDAGRSVVPSTGKLRFGLIWDRPEREEIYRTALKENKPKLVDWWADPAHIELRLK